MESGGLVSNTDGYLARSPGSTATATVAGSGSKWSSSGGLYISDFFDGGTASLSVADQAIVQANDLIHAQNNALVDLSDGTLIASLVRFSSDSRLSGIGTVEGMLWNDGGIIDIGHSPGTFSVLGDYIQATEGRLIVEIGGLTPGSHYDVLDVTGRASLDGELEIHLINGFMPNSDDVFSIFSAGALEGKFRKVSMFGGTFDLEYSEGILQLSDYQVPEPSTFVLMTTALLGGLTITWRRRRPAVSFPSRSDDDTRPQA